MKDRQMRRTERRLHEALGSLVREKPYDTIVVREILERAEVGRSTFYTHFRDKDDLLAGGIHDVLGAAGAATPTASTRPSDRLLWFSLPVFQHIDRHRQSSRIQTEAAGWAQVHEHLRRIVAEVVADELQRIPPPRQARLQRAVPPDLLADNVASTFILVLAWWVERGGSLPPEEIDKLFRSLIVPTLTAALD
jgi:AcrR family transcriptional regulator